MGSLREWLDEQTLAEETVFISGREFLCLEIDLAERSRLFAEFPDKEKLTDAAVEGLMLCRCVVDPETKEQVVPIAEWKYWRTKGGKFGKLLSTVLRLNGLTGDPVGTEVKNSDATQA
jgi:hypothetical protein